MAAQAENPGSIPVTRCNQSSARSQVRGSSRFEISVLNCWPKLKPSKPQAANDCAPTLGQWLLLAVSRRPGFLKYTGGYWPIPDVRTLIDPRGFLLESDGLWHLMKG
jgi:hypothetical protein